MFIRPRFFFGAIAVALLSITPVIAGKTIRVEPGPGAIARAMGTANYGDVIALGSGQFEESVRIAAGIILRGAGPGETVLIGRQDPAITVAGRHVVIRGIEVRGSGNVRTGIASSYPVRIERCRFRELPTGVSLDKAPLSDVVFCAFVNCDTGVRASDEASPTIWGCAFRGGTNGVIAENGGPYIRNNFFHDLGTAITLNTRNAHTMIVRNNVLTNCTSAGIELKRSALQSPFASIRNNIIAHCPVAMRGAADLMKGVTHCAIDQCRQMTEPAGAMNPQMQNLVTESLELTVSENGTLTIGKDDLLRGRGMRLASEERGTKADIGFTDGVEQPGCDPGENATTPPVRFESEPYIANATCEEHQYIALKGLRVLEQSLYYHGEQRYDGVKVNIGGRPREIRFNVDRFYGESPYMQP